jgi:LEA14-like dessication related protein
MKCVMLLWVVMGIASCAPKEPVVLREVHIIEVTPGPDGAVLKADAVLYNPNKGSLRLKGINLDILLDGTTAARIDQKLNAPIKSESTFTVPLEVKLKLSDSGLLDTLLGLIGGKEHTVRFTGKLKVSVGGFPVRIPVQHEEKFKF